MDEVFNQLTQTLANPAAQGRTINLFFRDDDVDVDEESLRRLLDLFTNHQLPIVLGVIPANLNNEGIALLKAASRASSGRIELVQHGWQHINHEIEGRKCEFGMSRNYEAQYSDIARGYSRLSEAFGADFFPAFIPPWNRCTTETFEVLDKLSFRVLSKDSKEAVTGYRFRDISTTLDIFTWRHGAALKHAAQIVSELGVQLGESKTIGILLHHKVMNDEAFALLARLLEILSDSQAISFRTLKELSE